MGDPDHVGVRVAVHELAVAMLMGMGRAGAFHRFQRTQAAAMSVRSLLIEQRASSAVGEWSLEGAAALLILVEVDLASGQPLVKQLSSCLGR